MRFTTLPVRDAALVDLEKRGDDRGFFARFFCKDEFAKAGLNSEFAQINTSLSSRKGTLRGMHFQLAPSAEVKVVRCLQGALWDVILDLRLDSETFGKWYGAELTADNRTMMYVPRGFAHGFVTLTDDVEALYLVSDPYAPALERGVRWNDPRFAIEWPVDPAEISDKDANWPDFDADALGLAALKGVK